MNKRTSWLSFLVLLLCVQAGINSCANVSSPTGGPKDTIPPALVKINPTAGTIHFNDRIVRMEFSEPIQVKELTNQLIITPSIEGKYKTKLSKNSLEIAFEEAFEDNTTYTFNFREAIQDLNEGNPAKELQLAFSTGAYLDSLTLNGQVKGVLTNEPVEDALVTLYRAKDTLNIFNSRPYYLAKTGKQGFFQFTHLKAGDYLLYASKDVNKNLMADPKNEPFGFLKDTLSITGNKDSLNINILSITINEPRINSSRPSGLYYEINLNKAVKDFQLQPLEEVEGKLYSNLVEGNKKVRVYNTLPIKDSLAVYFSASDSLNQQVQDTLYLRFEESKRPAEEFKYSIEPQGGAIQESYTATINFTKPVLEVNTDSLFFHYDSLSRLPLGAPDFTWNKTRDKLSIRKQLDPAKAAEAAKLAAEAKAKEAAQADTSKQDTGLTALETEGAENQKQGVTLHIGKGAFISVENDSSAAKSIQYTFANPKNFGSIQGTVATEANKFTVQLLQPKTFKVVEELLDKKNFTFQMIPPGEYQIRVLIDENENGQWDPGNVHKREEPEPVLFSKGTTVLKANWEVKDILISE